MDKNKIKSTTIIGIRKKNLVVIAGDGQASLGNTVMKSNVKKIRRLGADETVISGFAGSTADAFAALLAYGPPEPIASIPSSDSITSPVPDNSKLTSLSATIIIASNLLN